MPRAFVLHRKMRAAHKHFQIKAKLCISHRGKRGKFIYNILSPVATQCACVCECECVEGSDCVRVCVC